MKNLNTCSCTEYDTQTSISSNCQINTSFKNSFSILLNTKKTTKSTPKQFSKTKFYFQLKNVLTAKNFNENWKLILNSNDYLIIEMYKKRNINIATNVRANEKVWKKEEGMNKKKEKEEKV